MADKKYVDDAIVADVPESLMDSAGLMVEEVGIAHKLIRPKRPKKIAASAAFFDSYKILKDYTTDAGRYFMFVQVLAETGEPIQHIINTKPYKGQAWENAGDFYRMLRDEKKLIM